MPYDVINTEEAAQLAEGRPLSFLHVIRPEIDLPEGVDEHDAAVYAKGSQNLWRYAESDLSGLHAAQASVVDSSVPADSRISRLSSGGGPTV